MSYRRSDPLDDPYLKSFRRSNSPPRRYADDSSRLYRDLDLSRTDPSLERHVSHDVISLEAKLASRETRIAQLEREVRTYQDVEVQMKKTIDQLKERCDQLDKNKSEVSTHNAKAELTISTLQQDNRQLQERILELESRLRRHIEDREITTHSALEWEKNYEELRYQLSKIIFPNHYAEPRSHEAIMRRLNEFYDETNAAKSRILKLEDNLAKCDDELKQSKESLRRLLDDHDKTKNYVNSADKMKLERDEAVKNVAGLKAEIKRLEERLASSHDLWENTNHELRTKHVKLSEIDANAKKHQLTAQAIDQELKAFKESLALLLSEGYKTVQPTEDSIKAKIREITSQRSDVTKVSQSLEGKIKQLSDQLEEQAKLHKNAVGRAKKAEEDVEKLKEKLKNAEGELKATDILKSGMHKDTKQYTAFLERMAETMKLDLIARELGVDLNGDALLARAEQLVKIEEEQLRGRGNATVLALQRQLKETKKQLENKDLHLDVLRKKMTTMETDVKHKVSEEWEDLGEKNKRLSRELDKLKKQLNDANRLIHTAKGESVENKSLRMAFEEQRKTIEEYERRLRDLDNVRVKQAKKIAAIKQEKDSNEMEIQHEYNVTGATIQSLSNELQRVKLALDDCIKREKQLLDLRSVIARMLGLDVVSLAVPDYEIISRLERLVEGQNEMIVGGAGGHYKDPGGKSHTAGAIGYMSDSQRRANVREISAKGYRGSTVVSKRY